jgi:type II secretory pathway pseudopilin PulG
MQLAGQGSPARPPAKCSRLDDRGYILVVLLVGMAISAIWLAAALPVWRQQAQRERETELIFRGQQYARAVALYYKKFGTLPTDVDTLVSQRFLRRKWKDPITGDDFNVLYAGGATPGDSSGTSPSNRGGASGPASSPGQRVGGASPPAQSAGTGQRGPAGVPNGSSGLQVPAGGGMIGVASKSTATSIKIYNNLQEYDLWQFTYQAACQQMGGCAPPGSGAGSGVGRGAQGGRGPQQGPRGVGPGGGRNRGQGAGGGSGRRGSGGGTTGPRGGGGARPVGGGGGGGLRPVGGGGGGR